MTDPYLKVFEDFLARAEDRFRTMRQEIRNELLVELRSEVNTERGPPGDVGPRGDKGMDGAPGEKGEPGRDGVDGRDGTGIKSALIVDGELVLTLTDGSTHKAGRVVGPPGPAGKDGRDGLDGKEGAPGPRGEKGDPGMDGKDGSPGERGEKGHDGIDGRDGSPGRDGRDGTKGDPGRDGKDGRDGLTRDDLHEAAAEIVRSIKVEGRNWKMGDRTLRLPIPEYLGVYQEGKSYEPGDMTTFGGGLWHCNEPTQDKPGTSESWTLAVKKGRDGRDAKP
jgi:hypothetical protein